jgi:hypothetical protein
MLGVASGLPVWLRRPAAPSQGTVSSSSSSSRRRRRRQPGGRCIGRGRGWSARQSAVHRPRRCCGHGHSGGPLRFAWHAMAAAAGTAATPAAVAGAAFTGWPQQREHHSSGASPASPAALPAAAIAAARCCSAAASAAMCACRAPASLHLCHPPIVFCVLAFLGTMLKGAASLLRRQPPAAALYRACGRLARRLQRHMAAAHQSPHPACLHAPLLAACLSSVPAR